MKYSIITNCTSRKRNIGIDAVMPHLDADVSFEASISDWFERIQKCSIRVAPLDLYQGRSIAESRLASRLIGADLFVLSAGLGLVPTSALIPNYSLTIAAGTGSIENWLRSKRRNSTDWWNGLCSALGIPYPISSMVNQSGKNDRVLIALPARYVEMIACDLDLIDKDRHENIRIFTSSAGAEKVPYQHRPVVMPYDERLEGIVNHNGTRSDFPQRALKHFVAQLNAQQLSLQDARDQVNGVMKEANKRSNPLRVRASDDQIQNLIVANWKAQGGSASKLLRFLRDDAKVSCEQSRFSGIWRRVLTQQSR